MEFFERLTTHTQRRMSRDWERSLGGAPLPETKLPSGFEIGGALQASVEEIRACGTRLLRMVGSPLSDHIRTLVDELDRMAPRIAVVGQIKAGKSSFINALTGRTDFLPTHANPWTAVPTKLYFGAPDQPQKGAVFEFFSQKEWNRLSQTVTGSVVSHDAQSDLAAGATARMVWRRALMRIGERYHHLLGEKHRYDGVTPDVLSHYLCVGPVVDEPSRKMQAGRYADITRLAHVFLPNGPFACPAVLIDTPGLNDPTFIRIKTTETILEYADAYVVILTASQPLSFTDITLLRQLRGLEKRRFLVFINRIDELSGGQADVQTVENHVRSRLRREFPGASIAVISGSARWANAANDGDEEQLRSIAASQTFQTMVGTDEADIPDDMDGLRSLIFETSGMPGLGLELSEMMLGSFLASEGAAAVNLLKSAAEVTASAARLELMTLRELAGQGRPSRKGSLVHAGIAQLDTRLRGLTRARERIAALIAGARDKIEDICKSQCASIRISVENSIEAFAAKERRRAGEHGKRQWSFDATAQLKQIETCFLELFTAAIKSIAAVHDEGLAQVRGLLETTHTGGMEARKRGAPDIRRALPALAASINVNVSQPWWQRWWGAGRTAEDSGRELEVQIRRVFAPVAERLVAVAEHELAASGEEACINLETAASSAISSTSARLHDLQQRLLQYDKQERSQQVEMVSKDYAKGIKDLLYVIAQCEAITARLDAIGAGIDRDA